jgi:monoamine oxidase
MEQPDYDTLIIGAGVAGLAAGRALVGVAHRVAILEARNHPGGRISTTRITVAGTDAPIAVELGAEFVHGLPQETWSLLQEAGLAAYELSGTHVRAMGDRLAPVDDDSEGGGDLFYELVRWAEAQPRARDATFNEFLRAERIDGRAALRAVEYVEGFNAADSNLISVAALARQQRAEDAIAGDRLFRVRSGYASLPAFLAAQFEQAGGRVLLNRIVRRIAWRPGSVSVHAMAADGQELRVQARRAIITVPLGVLQANSIEFMPAPGQALSHAHRMAMGPVVRVTLLFSARFWRTGGELDRLSFLFSDDEIPATWWTAAPETVATLTGWVGGARSVAALQARIEAGGGEDALLRECLDALARIFGRQSSELREMLVGWYTHDWHNDEFARGAYSYVPKDALDASNRMAEPVENTLYFAGEHTDLTGHWGTVHGALRSGLRAAEQIRSAWVADPTVTAE